MFSVITCFNLNLYQRHYYKQINIFNKYFYSNSNLITTEINIGNELFRRNNL